MIFSYSIVSLNIKILNIKIIILFIINFNKNIVYLKNSKIDLYNWLQRFFSQLKKSYKNIKTILK